jgi:hypothetical protein
VFDKDFFGPSFTERVGDFSRDNAGNDVRVEIVTLGGQRFDVLQVKASNVGTRLYTRDDQMVFVPYSYIAQVEVSVLKDHRIAGFQLSPSPE